jgi:hypothetical protein
MMRAPAPGSSTLAVTILLVGGLLLGGLVALFGSGVSWLDVALAAALVGFGVFLISRRSQRFDLLDPAISWSVLFWVYTLVGSSNAGFIFGSMVTQAQWWIHIAAFAAFLAGSAIGRWVASTANARPNSTVQVDPLQATAWGPVVNRRNVVMTLGIVAVVWSFATSGVPLLGNVDTARLTYQSPLGFFWAYALRLVVAGAIASGAVALASSAGRSTRIRSALLIGLGIALLVATGSRSFFVPVLIAVVVLAGSLGRRIRIGRAGIAIVALAIALSVFASYRTSTQSGGAVALQSQLARMGVPAELSAFGSAYLSAQNGPHALAKAMTVVPTGVPFQHGRMLVGEIGTFLPGHQLLPDQWVAVNVIGTIPAQLTGGVTWAGQAGGIPPGILGGFYIDFGIPGIMLGMLGVGVLLSWLYQRVLMRPTVLSATLYASVFAFFVVCIYGFVSLKPAQLWELVVLSFIFWPMRGVALPGRRSEPAGGD